MSVPYQSGFCSIKHCEGTKPRGILSGTPMQVCTYIQTCKCKCHANLDKLFEMTGTARVPQENPEYHPAPRSWWMPSPEDRVASSIAAAPTPVRVIQSTLPALVPATIERVFAPTATGRAGRGELESWVKRACDEWLLELPEERCTPAWLAAKISQSEDIKEPSQGAIGSVLDRWAVLGFAVNGKKPVRFTGYTVDGIQHGLEYMKIRAKQNRHHKAAALNRGEKH